MALSKAGLNKALKKFQPMKDAGKTVEEITTEISIDENGYEPDEVKQLLEALGFEEEKPEPKPAPNLSASTGTKPPELPALENQSQSSDLASILAGIDYKNLKGETFKKYVQLVGDRSFVEINDEGKAVPVVGKLQQNDSFDFEQYRAKPIFKDRFPGMEGTPRDYVGIEIIRDKPEHTSRIPVSVALEFNAQILNQHSRAGHGRYYLLKK
jgi:hypothetical protein